MYLRENGVEVRIARAGTQLTWAYGDNSVNLPNVGMRSL